MWTRIGTQGSPKTQVLNDLDFDSHRVMSRPSSKVVYCTYIFVCISLIYMYIYLSIYLSIYLCTYLSIYPPIYLPIYSILFFSIPFYPILSSIYLSIYLNPSNLVGWTCNNQGIQWLSGSIASTIATITANIRAWHWLG